MRRHRAFGACLHRNERGEHVAPRRHFSKKAKISGSDDGELPFGVTAKDLILGVINRIGTGAARGTSSNTPERRSKTCR
jgi:hypothetical protein